MSYSNHNPQTDIDKLKVLVLSDNPPTNQQLLGKWEEKASLPILKRYLKEWIGQLNGASIVTEATYDEAKDEINKEEGVHTFKVGGTVGSVKEYFESLDMSKLPDAAQVFIKEQLLNPPADFKMDNSTFLEVKELLDSLTKVEEPVVEEAPERTVFVEPAAVETTPTLEEVVAAAKKAQQHSKTTLYIYKHPATGLIYYTNNKEEGEDELEVLPYEAEEAPAAVVEPVVEVNEDAATVAALKEELENITPALEYLEGEDKVELEEKIQSLKDAIALFSVEAKGGGFSSLVLEYAYPKYKHHPAVTQYYKVDTSKEIKVGGQNEKGYELTFKDGSKSNVVITERKLKELVAGKEIESSGAMVKVASQFKKGGHIGTPQREMDKTALSMLVEYSGKLFEDISDKNLPAWAAAKISKAEFTVAAVKHNLEAKHPDLFAAGGELSAGQYAKMQLKHIHKYSKSLLEHFDKLEFEAWMSSLLFVAADYLDGIYHYEDYAKDPKLAKGGHADFYGEWFFHLRAALPGSTGNKKEYQYQVEVTGPSGKKYKTYQTWSSIQENATEAKRDIKQRLFETGAMDALTHDKTIKDENGNPYFVESEYAKGGKLEKSHYISYLDKDNGFKETKKHFGSYEEAVKWGRENLENFNLDMVHVKFATGGGAADGLLEVVVYPKSSSSSPNPEKELTAADLEGAIALAKAESTNGKWAEVYNAENVYIGYAQDGYFRYMGKYANANNLSSEKFATGGGWADVKGSVTIVPYEYTGTYHGQEKQIVWVDTKYAHPDPSKVMTWGYGEKQDTVSDFSKFFTKVGKGVMLEFAIPRYSTANEEKGLRAKAIREYIAAGKKETGGYVVYNGSFKEAEFAAGGRAKSYYEVVTLRYQPGDVVYVFQFHTEPNLSRGNHHYTKEELKEYNSVLPKYVVGEGHSRQKWSKVEIIKPISDEKYWERYLVKQLDGYHAEPEFVAGQSQMSKQNEHPIASGYQNPDEMATGGHPEKWIQKALAGGHKGALRETAKRLGLIHGKEKLTLADVHELETEGGITAKRAHTAETLMKMHEKGGEAGLVVIFNETDGIYANPVPMTTEKAEEWIAETRKAFKEHQGYYKTSKGERINPDHVKYVLMPA